MPRRPVARRRSLLTRLLAVSVLVAVCSVAATTWLAARTTTGAIQQEQGQALAADAHIYDVLVGYAATHRTWSGAEATVRQLAQQTGRRIALTTQARAPIADSATGTTSPLPVTASAVVDPLAVDPALLPGVPADRVDTRVVGPFLLPPNERATLQASAARVLSCIRTRTGSGSIVDEPSGRPRIVTSYPSTYFSCGASELDLATPTEQRAITALDALTNACLARAGQDPVRLGIDLTASGVERRSAQQRQQIQACIATARHEQLTPYVAPAALLFVTSQGDAASPGFTLSAANKVRIVGAGLLVLVVTVAFTVLAGIRLIRPLRALTDAAQRMTDGEVAPRVRTTGRDEIGQLATAFNDMADHRQLMEEQRRTMVSDIAHELRTPLSNIRGWLEAAEDGVAARDGALITSLLEEALLLQHIVDDLQDLAMADAGTLRLNHEPVRIADVLGQVVTAHRARADVTLSADVDPDLVVDADPVRLRQAVGNLVANALRHTPSGGRVTVTGRRADDQVVITVADTGTGISETDLPHVFDRFWRAEKSRTRQTGGSGLGLAITRKLVEAHGGTITATSQPGAGSTFTVHLPATTVS